MCDQVCGVIVSKACVCIMLTVCVCVCVKILRADRMATEQSHTQRNSIWFVKFGGSGQVCSKCGVVLGVAQ
jgi:hypothetical protein